MNNRLMNSANVDQIDAKKRREHEHPSIYLSLHSHCRPRSAKDCFGLNAVNPRIGGVLIRGQKGTGKSLAVRALAEVLPEIEVVLDHRFNCSPSDPTTMCEECLGRYERGENILAQKRKMRVVTLPIGSTEDRVIGSLDIARARQWASFH